jgi:hypothetical protein
MDIKIIDTVTNEENKPIEIKEPESEPAITGLTDEYISNSVGQLFDLKPSEMGLFSNKIQTLIEYAKTQTDDKSPEGIKWALRSLQGKVGTPPLGEKWINYLGKYAYLKLEQIKLDKEAKKYEKNI